MRRYWEWRRWFVHLQQWAAIDPVSAGLYLFCLLQAGAVTALLIARLSR